jgi:hypothetical protein
MSKMKKVIISRPAEDFNKRCSYKILIGKTLLGELGNGETKTVEITIGAKR